MYVLNYLYFLIITIVGYKWLTSSGSMKYPLDKHRRMWLDGPERFWILTFSTGLLAFSAPGGLDLMAVRLFVLELFCLLGLLFVCKRKTQWTSASIVYVIYLLWLVIGLTYSPAPDYGFRVILKYIYPLLIMLFASAAVRDTEVFLKAGLGARMVALISIAFSFIPFIGKLVPGVFWYAPAKAINHISICMFSLAMIAYTKGTRYKKSNIYYTILFILPCFLWVFRTSIMGTTLAFMVFFIFKYRLKSLPIIYGFILLFVVAVFAIPSVREKMFVDSSSASVSQLESGELSTDNIDSNGRFAMWEWSLDRFYHGRELIGTGTGNLQETFYALRHPFGTIRIVHCDYVQMLCDNGLIGLILFGCSFLFLIFHCFVVYQSHKYHEGIRMCAIVAGSSMAGVLLTMMTDNVINYSMATISYPCGFYGMMLGMMAKYKMKNR
ncbi:polymerase [Alistipes sp. An116]|nr:O-antigen ligase family protein [Alistipes sp. An116]OUQ51585.1 polymerase [Alistipes sp. An116]